MGLIPLWKSIVGGIVNLGSKKRKNEALGGEGGGNTIADSKYLKLFLHFAAPAPSSLHFPSPTTWLLKSLFVLCAPSLWGRTCLQHDHQGGNFVSRAKRGPRWCCFSGQLWVFGGKFQHKWKAGTPSRSQGGGSCARQIFNLDISIEIGHSGLPW